MIYKISLHLNNKRTTPIFSHYRPDWVSDSKPEYNCAQVLLNDRDMMFPGETCECRLQPLMTNLWKNVKVGDVLSCREGLNEVGTATVLDIDESKETIYPTITFPSKTAEAEYNAQLEQIGFNTISTGPTINMSDVKRRRFNIK